MTGFNTQVGGGMYRIQLETDRVEVFNAVQNMARKFVDTEKSRKEVVSKNEKTTATEKTSVCNCVVCPENSKED